MPSPTSSTWPVSRDSILSRYFSISACSTELISPVLNIIGTRHQLIAQSFQSRLHRAVKDPIADLDRHAAEQFGHDANFQNRIELEFIVQFLLQCRFLLARQRRR